MAKEYRNAIRSRKQIRLAFANLLAEKGSINKISVKEIVERADISKSTFYAHYTDLDALVKEIVVEMINSITDAISNANVDSNFLVEEQLNHIFDMLKEHDEEYKLILKCSYPKEFIDMYREKLSFYIDKYPNMALYETNNNEERKAVIHFITAGLIETVLLYYNGKIKVTLDELRNIIENFLRRAAN